MIHFGDQQKCHATGKRSGVYLASMNKKKKWLIGTAAVFALGLVALSIVAYIFSIRFEPYIREQAILYLQQRFESEVELAGLRVRMPRMSPLRLLLANGRGAFARVEGEGVVMRHRGRTDVPPMFLMKQFSFEVDLSTLFSPVKIVQFVTIDGMEINIPPKGERPTFTSGSGIKPGQSADLPQPNSGVLIQEVNFTNSTLTVLPRDKKKYPLRFDIHRLRMDSAGRNVAMRYDAALTNAKPPGEILSKGTFGPWAADEPGDSPLEGEYVFDHADLGVFKGIAGILDSTGKFEGTLSSLNVKGETSVPDFRLKMVSSGE